MLLYALERCHFLDKHLRLISHEVHLPLQSQCWTDLLRLCVIVVPPLLVQLQIRLRHIHRCHRPCVPSLLLVHFIDVLL
jgi:hypothetical protein